MRKCMFSYIILLILTKIFKWWHQLRVVHVLVLIHHIALHMLHLLVATHPEPEEPEGQLKHHPRGSIKAWLPQTPHPHTTAGFGAIKRRLQKSREPAQRCIFAKFFLFDKHFQIQIFLRISICILKIIYGKKALIFVYIFPYLKKSDYTLGRPKVMLNANKQKIRQVNIIFILLNVLNNPHGCLYIVVYLFNIFEKSWGTLL